MRRKGLVIGVTVIGLLAGYVYSSPYITLFMLQRAMEMKNAKDVEKFIDFPGVRDSLRSQYSEYIKEYVKGDQQDMGLAAITAGVGNALAGTFIDLAIQPSNLQKWLDGNSITPGESTGLDISVKSLDSANSRVSMSYLDPETFEVRFNESGPFKSIVLERRNVISWKIVGISMDLSLLNQISSRGANDGGPTAPDDKYELESDVSYVDEGPGDIGFAVSNNILFKTDLQDRLVKEMGPVEVVTPNIIKVDSIYYCRWEGFADEQVKQLLGSSSRRWWCTPRGIEIHPTGYPPVSG